MKMNQLGFNLIHTVLLILFLAGVTGAGYRVINTQNNTNKNSSTASKVTELEFTAPTGWTKTNYISTLSGNTTTLLSSPQQLNATINGKPMAVPAQLRIQSGVFYSDDASYNDSIDKLTSCTSEPLTIGQTSYKLVTVTSDKKYILTSQYLTTEDCKKENDKNYSLVTSIHPFQDEKQRTTISLTYITDVDTLIRAGFDEFNAKSERENPIYISRQDFTSNAIYKEAIQILKSTSGL